MKKNEDFINEKLKINKFRLMLFLMMFPMSSKITILKRELQSHEIIISSSSLFNDNQI